MSSEYLPDVYVRFRDRFPGIAEGLDALGTVADGAGPLDERTRRLVKLGIAIGAMAEGAVRSNARARRCRPAPRRPRSCTSPR